MIHTGRFLLFSLMVSSLTFFSSCGGPAETGLSTEFRAAIDAFLEVDNAGKEPAQLATEVNGPVRIAEGDGLTIVASSPDGNTYVLRREETAEIDMLLPKTFEQATLIYADRSAIIIDHSGKYHYVLSLDGQPDLPKIPEAEYVVFSGNGLIRFGE
ncbi:hypothetical protein [Neolewinella agarilytica]|uniref:Uncharacterized protein n=1 Tax=Neolewinella agarilytica TaxID=478744 RepID=A0A1H9DRL0_9BACT|nr:hypothetical protein [Neolewinella agarilytica]SEQ16099.1 hypothetical protein SAMN05444359_106105 [Neolewinella agarilytica]